MTQTCSMCLTQIPFGARVCPNCTRDQYTSGSSDVFSGVVLVAVLGMSAVIVGVVEFFKYLAG